MPAQNSRATGQRSMAAKKSKTSQQYYNDIRWQHVQHMAEARDNQELKG